VGQIWGVAGAILVGAGVVGLLLALSVASLRAFAPAAPAAQPEQAAEVDPADDAATAEDLGYDAELGYAEPETVAAR